MKVAVIQFPGSNCDSDCYHASKNIMNWETEIVWHENRNLDPYDLIILPGGFSYGDYLRAGAIARFSPIIEALHKANEKNKLIVGICNGFQILTESGLLPGALMRNQQLNFICQYVPLIVKNANTKFSTNYNFEQMIQIPIAHGEGNYQIDLDGLEKLKKQNQIVFKYAQNPNGSIDDIAGICNEKGNVLGMMPHPERCVESLLGGIDGINFFRSIDQSLNLIGR